MWATGDVLGWVLKEAFFSSVGPFLLSDSGDIVISQDQILISEPNSAKKNKGYCLSVFPPLSAVCGVFLPDVITSSDCLQKCSEESP